MDKIQMIRAEIERRRDFYLGQANACIGTNIVDGLDEALSFIDSLPDGPKVEDLEMEIHKEAMKLHTAPCYDELEQCARHFYELGKNARKEK